MAAQFTDVVVPAKAARRPPWWTFKSLARRLGFSVLPGDAEPDGLHRPRRARRSCAAVATAMRCSRDPPQWSRRAVHGWVHERVLPPGGWRLAPPLLLASLREAVDTLGAPTAPMPAGGLTLVAHRRLRMMNSHSGDIGAPGAALETVGVLAHPAVVEAFGGSGAPVRVESAHGHVDGVLVADDRCRADVVAIAHGFGDCNVSQLTSADVDIDPLTGMVRQSGIPVTLVTR
ncbi:MAG: molybdopterin dinucleotide binding domain-containing protein [Acidimicrobiia bacterium]